MPTTEAPEAVAAVQVPQSEEVWLEELRVLARTSDQSQWAIGDHLNAADEAWGEKYTRAERVTGRAKQTLKNWASVAARFDSSRRRYESRLTFGHFEAVRPLKDDDDQDKLLRRAEDKKWPVKELRNAVRLQKNRGTSTKPDPDQKDRVVVMVPRHLTSDFARAAGVHQGPPDEISKGIAEWLLGLAKAALGERVNGEGESA